MKVLRLVFFFGLSSSFHSFLIEHWRRVKRMRKKNEKKRQENSAEYFVWMFCPQKVIDLHHAAVNTVVSSISMVAPHDRTYVRPYARTIGAIWINFVRFPSSTLCRGAHCTVAIRWCIARNERLLLIVNCSNKSKKEWRARKKKKTIIVRLISHVRACVHHPSLRRQARVD